MSGKPRLSAKEEGKWRLQYEAKRAELVSTLQADALLQGSAVLQRYERKTKSGIKQCGPYHLWTRKERGKTVTVSLTEEQFVEVKKVIATRRKIERLLKEMQRISQRMLLDGGP